MKTFLFKFLKPFSNLIMVVAIAFLSSCSNTAPTASFQKVPAKSYSQSSKATSDNKSIALEEQVLKELNGSEELKIDEEALTASLKELGVSEKKSEKIHKRLVKLNEALEKVNSEPKAEPKKLSFAEKILVKKTIKKAEKYLSENNIKDIDSLDEASKAQQMNQKIRIGLILLLAGILLGIFIPVVGGIVALVGIVFLILGLVEM